MMKKSIQEFRQVALLMIKRLRIRLNEPNHPAGKYGHWWIEIGDPYDPASESYGWWPKAPVGITETFTGVEGELNATTRIDTPFRDETGLAFRDPHHGDRADETFHPLVPIGDGRTDGEIANCIRLRAREYNGKWQWLMEAGQNCHTFQLAILDDCGLLEPPENQSKIATSKYTPKLSHE
jgi:hypothetical protein